MLMNGHGGSSGRGGSKNSGGDEGSGRGAATAVAAKVTGTTLGSAVADGGGAALMVAPL